MRPPLGFLAGSGRNKWAENRNGQRPTQLSAGATPTKGEGKMANKGKDLQVGQTVRLEERACGYHIAVLCPGERGSEVVEIGPEHAVFEDAATGVRMQLPLYLV